MAIFSKLMLIIVGVANALPVANVPDGMENLLVDLDSADANSIKSLFGNSATDCRPFRNNDPSTKHALLYGQNACLNIGGSDAGHPCDNNVDNYLSGGSDSEGWQTLTITNKSPDKCLSASTYDTCKFNIGEGGVTKISFEYEIDPSCGTQDNNHKYDWAAFWLYSVNTPGSTVARIESEPDFGWDGAAEVDLVEGSMDRGLPWATNFDGIQNQKSLPDRSGQVLATFSGSASKTHLRTAPPEADDPVCNGIHASYCAGPHAVSPVNCQPKSCSDVSVSVHRKGTNGVSSDAVRQGNLQSSKEYFFAMSSQTGGLDTCKLTIKNLKMEGEHNCGHLFDSCTPQGNDACDPLQCFGPACHVKCGATSSPSHPPEGTQCCKNTVPRFFTENSKWLCDAER